MYAPLRSPSAAAHAPGARSSVGSAWRVNTSAVGRCRCSMANFHASRTSFASAGRSASMLGIARSAAAMCSTGWWVGPSSPTPMLSCVNTEIVPRCDMAASRRAGRM